MNSGQAVSPLFHSFILALIPLISSAATADWPNWRGPEGTGANPKATPPVTWSETENLRWKVNIPGFGQSTPIIWQDKIFLLAARPASAAATETVGGEIDAQGQRMSTGSPKGPFSFDVLCFSRKDGALIWQKEAIRETPSEGRHPTASFAPYSPVTDGKYLWVSFGSRGLYCYDLDGNLQWKTPLPAMQIKRQFGEGSSPLLVGDAIVVVQDHEGNSRIAAYNKNTGKMLWETPRDEGTTWASPVAITVNGATQVVTNATNKIRSYDLADGKLLWECAGMTTNVIPSPIAANGMVYCASGFRGAALMAIHPDRTGDITGTNAVAWTISDATPYVSTPLLYNNRLYFVEVRKASLSCADALTGEMKYTGQSLGNLGDIYASIIGAGGHVYIAGRKGSVAVVPQSDEFRIEAVNTLDDTFDATPVAVDGELYLRGMRNLYCIAAP